MNILPERILHLNKQSINSKGEFVAYWIQSSQRTIYNHALEYAIIKANELNIPLFCFFGLTKYPSATARPYAFMLQGLKELKQSLKLRNIQFIVVKENPADLAIRVAKDAKCLIVDRGYLRIQREWREKVSNNIGCLMIQIESDVLVPIQSASDKEEYAAKTIRNKINSKIPYFAKVLTPEILKNTKFLKQPIIEEYDISDIQKCITDLDVDQSVQQLDQFIGGESQALKRLDEFIEKRLNNYSKLRNDPSLDATSNLSPYLHFGMISPLYIYLEVSKRTKNSENREAFFEELIVRRELSMNFCYYNQNYDNYKCLPQWAQQTLEEKKGDKRQFIYSREQWEKAQTHDPYWNAAQKEAIFKGKIAGYMRMYWGKKIIEWSATPEEGYEILIYLNDKYHLDGRDPNGYAGVAWCFGKHDRPWARRAVFGTVRFMVDSGLKRKFDSSKYVQLMNKYKK